MIPFGDLLSQGWSIVGTDVVAAPDIQRAMGSKEWKDDILLTLQGPNSDVAFCHFTLGSTANSEGMLEVTCFKPVPKAADATTSSPPPLRSTPLIVPKS